MPGDSRNYLAVPGDGRGDRWSDEAAREGRRGSQHLLEVATLAAPSEVARQLNLAFGNRVVLRRRLILLDNEPVEIATSYYPEAIVGGSALAAEGKVKGGAPAVLAGLGYSPAKAVEVVEARRPNWDEEELLKLSGSWVLALTRTVYAADATPVELALNVMAPGRQLQYTVDV